MTLDSALARYRSYVERLHTRCHFREPGTNGPEDHGCNAYGQCTPDPLACPLGCAEKRRDLRTALIDARHLSQALHSRGTFDRHPGPPEACGSPHDVVCKAVW